MGSNNTPRFRPMGISGRFCISLTVAVLLIVGIGAAPTFAQLSENCIDCHGTFAEVHGSVNHNAQPAGGEVVIFADFDHDSAGWSSPSPQFGVTVSCATCHTRDLIAAHGNQCSTCHPQPYRSLGTWQGGCQQGGCHTTYHEDSIKAHKPFADPYAYETCNLCHRNSDFAVTSNECLNCHATYGKGNLVPPVTTANALAEYIGPARIDFSMASNGKVAVGTTFYSLNGADDVPGSRAFVSELGHHQVAFWSVDQDGNFEPIPKSVSFTVVEDTEPPVTTSDARASYNQGGWITLTATDNGTLGVKETYYRLDDGPVQTGTRVKVPAANGIIEYTLTFWSEDWSGNVEEPNSVNFTVTSGSGTIRLVWGDSDVSGSPCPGDPEAWASWTVRTGGWWGRVIASGSGACPDWSGVDDIHVQVGSTEYFVIVNWWDSDQGYDDESWFSNVYVTTPGQIVRLSY